MNTVQTAPIPIAFCITELEPGGAERCLLELVKRVDRREFLPVVYCLGPRGTGNAFSLAGQIEKTGARVHAFGARGKRDTPRVLRELKARMKLDRPLLVQNFLFHANLLGTLAARLAGVPHVVTGIRVAEHRAGWHLWSARLADRWVERHVCVSQAVREFSRDRGKLPEQKLVVIPNGVDVQRFAGAVPCRLESLGMTAARRVILHVGRLDAQKGLDWLLDLMPEVLTHLPQHDLVLAGDGPKRTALVEQAQRLRLAERVHFVGFRADVPALLAASDVLVLPSRWEGMPNVVLEAMAAGKPVVATDAEGVAEVLGPGTADQLISPRIGQFFAERLVEILKNPGFAANLGAANHQRVKHSYTLDAMADAYQALYRSLFGAK